MELGGGCCLTGHRARGHAALLVVYNTGSCPLDRSLAALVFAPLRNDNPPGHTCSGMTPVPAPFPPDLVCAWDRADRLDAAHWPGRAASSRWRPGESQPATLTTGSPREADGGAHWPLPHSPQPGHGRPSAHIVSSPPAPWPRRRRRCRTRVASRLTWEPTQITGCRYFFSPASHLLPARADAPNPQHATRSPCFSLGQPEVRLSTGAQARLVRLLASSTLPGASCPRAPS